MSDTILRSLFLDKALWAEVIDHGVDRGLPGYVLEKFQDPHGRAEMCRSIAFGEYEIEPPRTGYRPKDDGGERTFFANSPQDRLLLHAIYKWLMRNAAEHVHPCCRSYREGIGIGSIVRDFSKRIAQLSMGDEGKTVGQKFDIHKYFESVGREFIHLAFDRVEQRYGHSSVIDLLRRYYDSDVYYDSRQHMLVEAYNGIKQGCAVSAWLADVILYDLDAELSAHKGLYVRYSDDIIYVGDDYEDATECIVRHLAKVGLTLNQKKVEDITSTRFVRFLGYNVRGSEITLSQKWVKHFQHEIERRTTKDIRLMRQVRRIRHCWDATSEARLQALLHRATKSVMRFLYHGDGHYSWSSHVIGVVNRQQDLKQLHLFCLDALRAVYTGKSHIGGLGVSKTEGVVRGRGKNVTSNRVATAHLHGLSDDEGWIDGYYSIAGMHKLRVSRWLRRTIVAESQRGYSKDRYASVAVHEDKDAVITALRNEYKMLRFSLPDGKEFDKYYALPIERMTHRHLLTGAKRSEMRQRFENWIAGNISYENHLQESSNQWFWQSKEFPEFIILKNWFNSNTPLLK